MWFSTIVGSSEMVMRTHVDDKILYRNLSGSELLGFAGWHKSFFRSGSPAINDMETSQMAGNCFNAFAVAPLFSAVLATACMPVLPEDADEVAASISSDDSSNDVFDDSTD